MPATVQGIEFTINGSANSAASSTKHLVEVLVKLQSTTKAVSSGTSKMSSSMKNASSSAKNLAKSLSKIKSAIGSGLGKLMKFTAPIREIQAFSGAISGLANRFKRLLIMRTFRALIRAVTQAFKDGVNSLYQWSNALGGEFAASMDQCSTALNYLKNSLGTVAAPIINSLAPALDYVVDKIVLFLNALSQLIARLSGASYWTKATKAATTYGNAVSDAVGGAGSAAKEALKYLAPFDELNVLPSDSGSGGGGGGGSGGGGSGGGDLFEEMVSFDSAITDFADMIRSAWENADFTEVGELVATKLKDALDNIDWTGIQSTCNRIATSLATFINGFVETPGIWESIGQTIGNGINTAVGMWNTFFDTTHFDSIGSGIATALNNALETIDAYELGRALTQKLQATIELLYGFVTTFDWSQFGTSVGTALQGAVDNIDFSMAGEALSTGVIGLLDSATAAIKTFNWSDLGTQVANFLKNIDWVGAVSSAVDTLGSAIIGIGDTISGFLEGIEWYKVPGTIIDMLGAAINDTDWSGVMQSIAEALGAAVGAIGGFLTGLGAEVVTGIYNAISSAISYFQQNIEDCGGDIWAGIGEGIKSALSNAWQWCKDNILTPFLDGLRRAFGISSPAEAMKEDGSYIGEGILEGIKNAFSDIATWVSDNILTPLKTALSNIGTTFFNFGANIWNSIVDGIKSTDVGQKIADVLHFEWDDLKIPVTADITGATDSIPEYEKTIPKWKAQLEAAKDGIPSSDKILHGGGLVAEKMSDKIPASDKKTTGWTASHKYYTRDWDSRLNWTTYDWTASHRYYGRDWDRRLNWTTYDWTADHNYISRNWKSGLDWTSYYWTASMSYMSDNIPSYNKIIYGVNAKISGMKAGGGLYTGGRWHDITNFAGGGYPRGSQLFWAREAGPELVGTIGGHTAVMNNDQIVSSVAAGVARAVAGVRFKMTGFAGSGSEEDILYRAIIRALNDSDVGGDTYLDGAVLYQKMVDRNRQNTRMTGANAMAVM